MGDTFNAFIAFISEDSIMLGLCIAILILIIMFILVLILGKKKDSTKDVSNRDNEELLKTEINMEALKSTSEYKIDELNGEKNVVIKDESKEEEPPVSVVESTDVEEIPVTTEEPVKVEIEDNSLESEEEKPEEKLAISSEYPTFEDFKITEPEADTSVQELNVTQESADNLNNIAVIESNAAPVEDVNIENNEPVIEPSIEEDNLESLNIVESTTIPLDESQEVIQDSQDSVLETVLEPVEEKFEDSTENVQNIEEPILQEEIQEEALEDVNNVGENVFGAQSVPVVDSSLNIFDYSSDSTEEVKDQEVKEPTEELPIITENTEPENGNDLPIELTENVDDTQSVELPTMNEEEEIELPDYSDIYSVDDIELPNINYDEFKTNPFMMNDSTKKEDNKSEEDDLDLPKLNTNSDSSINALHGESFNIEK